MMMMMTLMLGSPKVGLKMKRILILYDFLVSSILTCWDLGDELCHCGLCHLWTRSDRKVFCWEENLQNASGRYLHSMSVGLSRLPMEESRHAKEVRRRMMHHHSYLEFFVCALLDR